MRSQSSIFFNAAHCASLRMDSLWQDACQASGNNWEPFHQQRWREWETYISLQRLGLNHWRRNLPPY